MASNLVPLVFPPGIKRDGTPFDSKYCTDGNWMRFYNKRPQSIGQMNPAAYNSTGYTNYIPKADGCSNILITQNPADTKKPFIYFCCATYIRKAYIQKSPNGIGIYTIGNISPSGIRGGPWQSLVLTHPGNGKKYVVFLATHYTQNTPPLLLYGLNEGGPLMQLAAPQLAKITEMNGGMVWSAPYLFLYGRNGKVIHSKSNDPFNFEVSATDPASGGAYNNIGNGDQVVFAYPISGGRGSPSLLLWTQSSLVRMTNVGTTAVSFEVKTLAQSISVLNNRAIIEKDGIFYWPGSNSFFTYNGVVTELDNSLNKQYFYDTIKDGYLGIDTRLNVFGVLNPEFNEIWWFFRSKQAGDYTNPGCDRAIIYNYKEQTWYDTQINFRTCTFYDPTEGALYSFGAAAPHAQTDAYYFLFSHENKPVNPGGQTNFYPVNSYITTPYFSFSSAIPSQNSESMTDRFVELRTLFPDFLLQGNLTNNPLYGAAPSKINLTVNTIEYPKSPVVKSSVIPIDVNDTKVDLRVQGRHMSLTFQTNGYLQMGKVVLNLGVGDGQ